MNGKREFGDYQTPSDFAAKICRYLRDERNITPSIVIEPTCGVGNFLSSSLVFDAEKYYGIEINADYCKECISKIKDRRVHIINANIFGFDLSSIEAEGDILVIGNPPWVNNSTLSSLNSDNFPEKKNFKGARGWDALTGGSNFDICEYIILRLIHAFRSTDAAIAMLCKTSVARNVFKELKREAIPFSYCDMITFDASTVFGISASACLLLIKLSSADESPTTCNLCSFSTPQALCSKIGFRNGQFYSDLSAGADDFDGSCCFEWRQGVKHDCSKVMELSANGGILKNGQGEIVDIEDDIIFPLIKSSMFKIPVISDFTKYVIVTQKKAREETSHIQMDFPKAWAYLNRNITYFNNRKSAIYRNAPAFSMFGIGDYSYSKYKVGVSGFYKRPLFSVLTSPDGKPVMTDDTSYFICFDSYDMAYVAMLILNSERVQNFLKSIVFIDAKRPYTKKILERLDFSKICKALSYSDLKSTECALNLANYLTAEMFNMFSRIPQMQQQRITCKKDFTPPHQPNAIHSRERGAAQ